MHSKFLVLLFSLRLTLPAPAWAGEDIPAQPTFTLGQAVQNLELEKKEYETLYRTDLVPDTCYRTETQGYRTECHTEYDRQCHTEMRQQCGFRSYPVCNSVPRTVCTPRRVCNGPRPGGGRPGPAPVCHTENSCRTVYDRICRNEQRYECWSFPQNYCHDVPRQACTQIPNIVQVPYACTKPVQVAIGQRLKLQTLARITLRFENFSETGPLNDALTARLEGNEIRISGTSDSVLYQVVSQSAKEQNLGGNARILNVEIGMRAIPIGKLNEFSSLELRNGRLHPDRVEFDLSRTPEVPLRGHLNLTRCRALARPLTVVDADFDPATLLTAGTTVRLPLGSFGAGPLRAKRHTTRITLTLDGAGLRRGAVNPAILNQVKNPTLETSFESRL